MMEFELEEMVDRTGHDVVLLIRMAKPDGTRMDACGRYVVKDKATLNNIEDARKMIVNGILGVANDLYNEGYTICNSDLDFLPFSQHGLSI